MITADEWWYELRPQVDAMTEADGQRFAIACCRRADHLMTDSRHQAVVEAAEKMVNGLFSDADFEAAMEPIIELWVDLPKSAATGWTAWHYLTGATRHLGSRSAATDAASYAARAIACARGPEQSSEWNFAWLDEVDAQRKLALMAKSENG